MTEKQTETNVGKYECVCGRRTGGSPASGSVEYRWFSLHFSATTLCSAPACLFFVCLSQELLLELPVETGNSPLLSEAPD